MIRLRKAYTQLRNKASSYRHAGDRLVNLDQQAKEASNEYHKAIRIQKKAHWTGFLGDHKNIWEAAGYFNPDQKPARQNNNQDIESRVSDEDLDENTTMALISRKRPGRQPGQTLSYGKQLTEEEEIILIECCLANCVGYGQADKFTG